MKIYLDELENNPENQLTLEFNEIIDELGNNQKITGSITASLTTYGVDVKGFIETDLNLECDRCLKSYTYHVNIDFDEKFIRDNLASDETKEIEITKENFVEELHGRKEIDITDLIYQSIILNIPSKKLCDVECPGNEAFQKLKDDISLDPRMQVFKKYHHKNENE